MDRGKDDNSNVVANGRNIAIITFDLELVTAVQPGQIIANTATLFNFSSKEGGPDYTTTDKTDTATTTIAVPAETKAIVGTNQNHTSGNNVAIGEIVTYVVDVTIREGTTPNTTLTDVLDLGLALVDCISVTPSSSDLTSSIGAFSNACNPPTNPTVGAEPTGNGTPVNQGRRITFNLGTLTNSNTDNATAEKLTFTYRAVVLNTGTNINSPAKTLKNTATFAWTGASISQSAPVVTVVEPKLQVNKTANPTSGDAGDTITFTMIVSHAAASNADAFDVSLSDAIPAGMSYVANSLFNTAGLAPASFGESVGTITASWPSFPQGSSSTFTFQVTLADTVTPGQSIVNTANVKWTSLPGTVTTAQSPYNTLSTERTGNQADPGGTANTYSINGTATVTVPAGPAKSVIGTSESHTTGANVAIGEIVRYRLSIQVPEGSFPNGRFYDALGPGLQFIDDGTAKVAFVSTTTGNITSSTLNPGLTGCSTLYVAGNANNVAPTCPLPDNAVSTLDSVDVNNYTTDDNDSYGDGTDVVFKLGDVVNAERVRTLNGSCLSSTFWFSTRQATMRVRL